MATVVNSVRMLEQTMVMSASCCLANVRAMDLEPEKMGSRWGKWRASRWMMKRGKRVTGLRA